jgi:hypothetical protein
MMYLLGKNGLEKVKEANLERGQILTLDGAYNKRRRAAIIEKVEGCAGNYYKVIDLEEIKIMTAEMPRLWSEKFGIGWYYNDGEKISESELQNALLKLPAADQERERIKMETAAKKELDRLAMIEKYKHLPARGTDYMTAKKNIIFELKTAFPSVKFSVTKRNYNTMTISWTDGVKTEQVSKITNKYSGKDFDGMQDMEINISTAFNSYFGEVGYLFLERDFSKDVFNKKCQEFYSCNAEELDAAKRWDDLRDARRELCEIDLTA